MGGKEGGRKEDGGRKRGWRDRGREVTRLGLKDERDGQEKGFERVVNRGWGRNGETERQRHGGVGIRQAAGPDEYKSGE